MTGTGNAEFNARHRFSNPSKNRVNILESPFAGSTEVVPNRCIIMDETRHMRIETAPRRHDRRLAAAALEGVGRRQPCGQPMPVHRQPIGIRTGAKGLGQPVFMIKSKFH